MRASCVIDDCIFEPDWLVVSAPDIVTVCTPHRSLCDDEWLEPTFLPLAATRAACTDGDPAWCCIEADGTGLWCDACLSGVSLSDAATEPANSARSGRTGGGTT